ncbi:MAG: hypothetical protein IH616_08870 [Gemmatimonadales bacterium]|nr:hypothetical protein [Gemmatimonadales bacterium]
MKATDRIVLFTPARVAELIGSPDALALLKACWQQAASAAWAWAMNGDITQPWCYADPAARGQVLVDSRTDDICTGLHGAGEARAMPYRRVMSLTGFEGRQFHRDEIARWLDVMGIDSDYAFALAEDASEIVAAPERADGENGGANIRWTKELVTQAWDKRQQLRNEGASNFMKQTAKHYGVSRERLVELFKRDGWM